jgi:threonylcarbamoyladenosine tRNA methylthiotransferase MtaB
MKGRKIAFYTLGCKLNFAETSALSRQFIEAGCETVRFGTPSDIVVINSCSVTSMADKKCRQAISKAVKTSPDALIAVIGCYAQLRTEEIAALPGVDLVLGAKDKFDVLSRIEAVLSGSTEKVYSCEIEKVSDFHCAFSMAERTRAFLKIQDGCDYHCAYCTIPLARGESRNAPAEQIISEANGIVAGGAAEIVLTGVNIGDFGKSTGESFFELLKALEKIPDLRRVRISSIEPNLLSEEILTLATYSTVIVPHFHIPLQSGSDKILGLMRRRYRREVFAGKVEEIRKRMPHACVGADVIVGFPGETEEDFEDTRTFLQALDLQYLHVFPYSERPNTPAAEMPGKVPVSIRELRCKSLIRLSEEKRAEFYKDHIGSTRDVLVEGRENNGMAGGFTDNYIKVEIPHSSGLTGKIVPVTLLEINSRGSVSGIIDQMDQKFFERKKS